MQDKARNNQWPQISARREWCSASVWRIQWM